MLRERLVREAAHRQPPGGAEPPACERQTEDGCRLLGVGSEHLEEVAETGQDDRVREVGLDGPVLAQDGRVAGRREVERLPSAPPASL